MEVHAHGSSQPGRDLGHVGFVEAGVSITGISSGCSSVFLPQSGLWHVCSDVGGQMHPFGGKITDGHDGLGSGIMGWGR